MAINAFKVHDTTTAPAPSAKILKVVQKAWGFVPTGDRVISPFAQRQSRGLPYWASPSAR
jgi:hypothetical protein